MKHHHHTQGPWTSSKNGEFINGKDRHELFTPRQATAADIRLIKAAPEMLTALEHVLKDTLANGEFADAEHVRILTDVIYKARGI